MKTWKYGLVIIWVSSLMLSSTIVSADAITDGQNDVIKSQTGISTYQTKQTKPDVDVKQITCTITNDTVALELEIYGTIQQISPYMYYAAVNTTDYQYIIIMNNGGASTFVIDLVSPGSFSDNPELIVGEHTMSAVFETHGDTTILDIFGYAKYSNIYISPDIYQDWAPDIRNPLYDIINQGEDNGIGGNGDTTLPRTPGFEVLIVIAAIVFTFILIKKRK